MACHGITALASDPSMEVICMLNPQNHRLIDRLKDLKIIPTPCTIQRLKNIQPDLVLCIQGDLTQSTPGIVAAKKAGIECVSYLALPHTRQQMGAKFGALRDRLSPPRIHGPSRYITLSKSMKQRLLQRGAKQPISIVPNGVSLPQRLQPKATHLRTLGLFGRIEFHQKQHDFLVKTFSAFPHVFSDCHLLIAGHGPDEHKLRQLIKGHANISLQPWQDDPDAFYQKIDLLVIPSRFEGVPLVMLEALARGLPVMGSQCDGMYDILPPHWTFQPGNGAALAKTFSTVKNTWTHEIEALQKKICTEYALKHFTTHFCQAVCRPMGLSIF